MLTLNSILYEPIWSDVAFALIQMSLYTVWRDSPYLCDDIGAHENLALGEPRGEELVAGYGRLVAEHLPHHLNRASKTRYNRLLADKNVTKCVRF